MPTQSESSGPVPLPTAVAEPAMGAMGFGVFRRYRSLAGAGVFPRGFPTRGARPVELVPLAEALSRRWEDDRHIVLYTADKPYRINNAALGKVHDPVAWDAGPGIDPCLETAIPIERRVGYFDHESDIGRTGVTVNVVELLSEGDE